MQGGARRTGAILRQMHKRECVSCKRPTDDIAVIWLASECMLDFIERKQAFLLVWWLMIMRTYIGHNDTAARPAMR
jgi:hypothetical protein